MIPVPDGQPFGSSSSGSAKRQAPAPPKLTKNREKLLASDPTSYLHAWASKMRGPPPTELPSLEDSVVELVKNSRGEYEIHQPKPAHIPHKSTWWEACQRFVFRFVVSTRGLFSPNGYERCSPPIGTSTVMEDLRRLYGQKKEEAKKLTEKKRSEAEIKKITEDLSNVDLD
ncbi:hypothetical protein MSG28_015300 [Choristoneura fumiferana]|uniref:Uncharacterized protein n=1 Tax=Choristoneura fumiferana TaxID=7141 RepID=A0ACC0K9R3_CHOFU|nr:hypothetical protein MSG28_015300 [Choristoneura fumiferana]